jgi:hypothetical protein
MMSLRKSTTLTRERLAANRRNARKSTGPRTTRGKAWSRLNRLRTGSRSPAYRRLWQALRDARPGAVECVAALTPEQASHPLFASVVDQFRQMEQEVGLEFRHAWSAPQRRIRSEQAKPESSL